MIAQRAAVALTIVNLVILVSAYVRPGAGSQDVVPVLRGRALEIVDERGHVRASITVLPADPKVKMPDGSAGYPESVLLRLRDSEGHPNVKIQATEDGAGFSFGGDVEGTYVQLLARGAKTSLKLSNHDGGERLIAP